MTNEVATVNLEKLIIQGDLSSLSPNEKAAYYYQRCKEHGLNPASKPFDYLRLNGKEVLYANKGCAEQLRSINKVSIKIVKADQVGDIFVVIAEAVNADQRADSATGAVSIAGLRGEALANAMMKAETKAKRRVTLSICGLNMLDETEIVDIPAKAKGNVFPEQPAPGDGFEDNSYKIPFGKFAKRTLEEVDINELRSYVEYLERKASEKGETIKGVVADFIERAIAHVVAFEAQEPGTDG